MSKKEQTVLNNQDNQKLHQIQLKMLEEFICVCQVLNLKYYALGGTVLGAVRHQGYIPWDDDIDIGMPRTDYEILLAKGPSLINPTYFIQSIHSEKDYPHNFVKIRNNQTTYIEESVKNIKMNHGVYIDIFPLDGVPNGKLAYKVFMFKNRLYSFNIRKAFVNNNNSGDKKLSQKLLILLFKNESYQNSLSKRENLYKTKSLDKSYQIANYGGAWGIKEIMPKEIFGKGKKLKFEHLEITVPEDCDKYLTRLYGDYMTLPPIEKRVTHHCCSVFNLDKPYTDYC